MFDVWTKGFRDFFLVFLVLGLVSGSLGALFNFEVFGTFAPPSGILPGSSPRGITSVNWQNLVLFGLVLAIVGSILGSIVGGGMTEYSVRRLRGEATTLEKALRRGWQKFPSILGANLPLGLLFFAVIFIPLLLLLPLALVGPTFDPSSALASICGALAIFVVGGIIAIYIGVAMSLYAPAIMMEDANAVGGLSRSWRLTKGHWWSIFGALLAVTILAGIIVGVITSAANVLDNGIVSIIAYAIGSGITGAWSVITAVVAYDLIVRQPRFVAPAYYPGPAMGPPPQPPAAPPAPPRGP
jgi:MFS family permease